jgi:hypothetical protein
MHEAIAVPRSSDLSAEAGSSGTFTFLSPSGLVASGCRLAFVAVVLLGSAALLSGCGGSAQSTQLGGTASSDPVVLDFPILYVRKPVLLDDDGELVGSSVREPHEFRPGAELLLRDRASPSAVEISLTAGLFPDDEDGNPPQYDVKDLSVSFDRRFRGSTRMSSRPGTSGSTSGKPAWYDASSTRISPPMLARMWHPGFSRMIGSCFHPPASAAPRPCCWTKASPSSRPSMRIWTKKRCCCT